MSGCTISMLQVQIEAEPAWQLLGYTLFESSDRLTRQVGYIDR